MTMHLDEHIYEWGKSLISFEVKADVGEQVGSVKVIGHNPMDQKSFDAERKAGAVSQKIGGGKDWTRVVANPDASWVRSPHVVWDYVSKDSKDAGELAEAVMREKSFRLMRAEGSGEGDPRLKAGATVTVKYVGKACSGEYIAHGVIHRFSLDEGYTTEFYLKRNTFDEEYMRGVTHTDTRAGAGGPGGQGAGEAGVVAESQAYDGGSVYGDDEDGPEFRGLKWRKGGREIGEALVDDEVGLFCEVKNIADGKRVTFLIFERGASKDDPVDEVEGEVRNGKVEALWKVIFKCEQGSNVAEELEERGWTDPDYYFIVKYDEVESHQGKTLDLKGWRDCEVLDGKTGKPRADGGCLLLTSDGKLVTRKTETDGCIKLKGLRIGEFTVIG
jgi:hypothetical protein